MTRRFGIASATAGIALVSAVIACVIDDVQGADIASLLAAVAAACLVYDARRLADHPGDRAHAGFVAGQAVVYLILVTAVVVIALWLPRQSVLLPALVAAAAALMQLVTAAVVLVRTRGASRYAPTLPPQRA